MVFLTPNPGPAMPGGFPGSEDVNIPNIPDDDPRDMPPPRRPSFSFLRRGKSVERLSSTRSVSNGKLSKRQTREQEMSQEHKAPAIPKQPPRIPDLEPSPQLQTFGGDEARPDSMTITTNRSAGYSQGRSIPRGAVYNHNSFAHHNVPIPPIPSNNAKNNGYVDPYARTESMTNRGRYSYASSAVSTINNPRRIRRRKDPTPFNVLVVGARNSGKTSFLEFLKTSLARPERKQRAQARDDYQDYQAPFASISDNFKSQYLETEIEGERIGLTLWDSEGLDKGMVDLQLREMSAFLESKFEDTFTEEMKVVRSTGVRDTHIHCVFLMLDPSRLDMIIAAAKKTKNTNGTPVVGKSFIYPPSPISSSTLDEDLDLQVMRTLEGKTTVVPVISKADTITTAHMTHLKRVVCDSLREANLDPLEALSVNDGTGNAGQDGNSHLDERDEDNVIPPNTQDTDKRRPIHYRNISATSHFDSASSSSSSSPDRENIQAVATTPYLPLSTISPDLYEPQIIGRKFPWGFADPYNAEHCDFTRLKEAVFKEWRGEMRQASRELWYERWRTTRLNEREKSKGRVAGVMGRRMSGFDEVGRAR